MAGQGMWRSLANNNSCSSLLASAFLAVLIAASPAVAGNISLGMTPEPEVREGALVVSLGIRNGGDEAARSVSPALQFLGKTTRADVRPLLRPNETWRVDLTAQAADLVTGRWPYRIMVDYADANDYPFHALHVGTVVVGAPPPAKVAVVKIVAPPLSTSGPLESVVKNLSPDTRMIGVAVHLPEGLELEEPVSAVEFAPWEERRVSTSLVNRTGLPGSRYAVFVSAEYDDGPLHQTVVVPTTVEIVAEQSVFKRRRMLLWLLAGLLVVAWGAVIGWRLAVRRRSPPRK